MWGNLVFLKRQKIRFSKMFLGVVLIFFRTFWKRTWKTPIKHKNYRMFVGNLKKMLILMVKITTSKNSEVSIGCAVNNFINGNATLYQGFLQQMWSNSQETANLAIFTEEILNGKLHFLCSASFKDVSWTHLYLLLWLFFEKSKPLSAVNHSCKKFRS